MKKPERTPTLVETLMTRDVASCRPDATLKEAASLMLQRDCGCVPVVDDEARLAGIVTDRDICVSALKRDEPLSRMRVNEAMTSNVYWVKPTDSLAKAERVMQGKQVRRVPVAEGDGHIVGILSLNDLARRSESGASEPALDAESVAETLAAVCEPESKPSV